MSIIMIKAIIFDFFDVFRTDAIDYEVVALASSLRRHYRLALLSNASSTFLRELLADHDLEQHFDEIVISSEVGLAKPSSEIFELTLRKLGVSSSQAIFIDDNERNTQAAEQCGIRSFQFVSATRLRQDLAAAGIKLE